jgi:V/A-type H+/Na+-transporting ATPase subunit I
MIVPMIRYIFLVHHQDHHNFLLKLKDLGVLHIQTKDESQLADRKILTDTLYQIDEVLHIVKNLHEDEKNQFALKQFHVNIPSGEEILQTAQSHINQKQHLLLSLENTENDLMYAGQWGDFDKAVFHELHEHGIKILLYAVHERDYQKKWEELYRLEIVNTISPMIYFVVILRDGEQNEISLIPSPIPDKTIHQLLVEKKQIQEELDTIQEYFYWISQKGIKPLEHVRQKTADSIELSEAIQQSPKVLDGKIRLLEGFVPVSEEPKISKFTEDSGIIFWKESVKPSDQPPVLLKNNKFTKLYESIGSLYSLPNYGEMDLTPFFAPFFMMFFGFCLGDAGYGLILLISSFVLPNYTNSSWKPMWILVRWLSTATIFFGMLTGTFFGINLIELPTNWLLPLQAFMLNSNQTFQLALMIGLLQILFGMGLKAINQFRQFGWKYSIAPVAWIIMVVGMVDWLVIKYYPEINIHLVWFGCVLILWFNDPEAKFFSRIGKGIWELYGITGLVGDLLSYIRLFALGISSAILGLVINDIALRLLEIKWIGWFLFLIFLIVGHTANMLIASLGAFVHPLRLTFVEFYKNAGFTGGGKEYKPFGGRN